MRLLTALSSLVLAAPATAFQTAEILVDLGTTAFPTDGTVAETWNDVDTDALGATFELLDSGGAPSGITWSMPGSLFTSANSAGTTSPQPGSPLAEFPVNTTRDVMYGQNGATVEIELAGFGPNQLVDFTFAATRDNVTDVRSADYLVQGFNGGSATLDASNNLTDTVDVTTILPDASGTISLSVRAASTNTNPGTHYFYLGGIAMTVTTTPGPPQVLAFDTPSVDASLKQGAGTFSTGFTLAESTGASPAITLAAVDDVTGLAPAWLSLPTSATVGAPVTATFDELSMPLGTYTATIVASAAGYPDATLKATLTVRDPDALNLLFYGNSYSIGNWGMPTLVGYIAEEHGYPLPTIVPKLVGGQDLFFHLTDPDQAGAIGGSLPAGEKWDFVVMQGFSLEATVQYGDPAAFRANALAILTNVKAHSPGAKAVLFQTWARGPGFGGYPFTYPGPYDMHAEISANYQLAVDDMNAAFGAGTAYKAAIGDAVALLAFDPSLYTSDWSHPQPPTSLMAGMGVYQAIFRERICDVDPDFGASGNLIDHLGLMGIGEPQWDFYGGIAERIADAELRRFPGSGEDLLLATGVGATQKTSCPTKSAGLGDEISARVTSPNGFYGAAPAFLVLDPFLTGFPPGQANPWPELHLHFPSAFLVKQTGLLGPGLEYFATIPDSLPGVSLMLQAIAFGPSAVTGNPVFTATDGHEIVLQ